MARSGSADGDPHGAWVNTDDLNGPNNAVHYTGENSKILGQRFAEMAIALINKQ